MAMRTWRLRMLTTAGNLNAVSLSPDGLRLAYTAEISGNEEQVHVVDLDSGRDRTVAVDKEGCIRPLVLCISCSFSCVRTPHLTADGSKVLGGAGSRARAGH